ncbi:MAG TPA: hypothetical protein VEV81_04680, partial [Pyrinomonadaceae bacterium]|nr:hypothetical protein [Pyrinomonadaceae bacterium]
HAFFESAARDGVGGAIYWIFTPDPRRGYSISYLTKRDDEVRAELRRAADLFAALREEKPPAGLLDSSHHLIPRQFAFQRAPHDPATLPETAEPERAEWPITYRFKPEAAASGRFEKLGGGAGYIWGSGAGYVEYVLPARPPARRSPQGLTVRAHIQPVLPQDAQPPVTATRVTLIVNGTDCGSRLVPVEDPKRQVVQEWKVKSLILWWRAASGLPLTIRFSVEVDADQPYGLNISNFGEGHQPAGESPIEVRFQ